MFLDLIELKASVYKSNAGRNSKQFVTHFTVMHKTKNLIIKKKWSAGRNGSGKIVIWTKGSLKKKFLSPLINANLRYNKLGLVSSFRFVQFKNKLLALIHYNNGASSYFNATENFNLFEYFYLNRTSTVMRFYSKIFWSLLFLIKKLSIISFIEIIPEKGAQYIKSSGTRGKLFNIDKTKLRCLIILPSKIKKIFSCFSAALLGSNALYENKNYFNGKSGYWRSFGVKSIVRGVAMNPVDHPHGGRTKAVRYQRTPWGKTTKKK